jgi:hypothetical protein
MINRSGTPEGSDAEERPVPEGSDLEETPVLNRSGGRVVPSGSFGAVSRVRGAVADAKVESVKNGSSKAGLVAVGAIGGLTCVALSGILIVRVIRRPLQEEDEEDEASKRALPETLLDEMDFESPLTLANTTVNTNLEPEADDFCA